MFQKILDKLSKLMEILSKIIYEDFAETLKK